MFLRSSRSNAMGNILVTSIRVIKNGIASNGDIKNIKKIFSSVSAERKYARTIYSTDVIPVANPNSACAVRLLSASSIVSNEYLIPNPAYAANKNINCPFVMEANLVSGCNSSIDKMKNIITADAKNSIRAVNALFIFPLSRNSCLAYMTNGALEELISSAVKKYTIIMLSEYIPNISGVKNRAMMIGTSAMRTWPAARSAAKPIKILPSIKLCFSASIMLFDILFGKIINLNSRIIYSVAVNFCEVGFYVVPDKRLYVVTFSGFPRNPPRFIARNILQECFVCICLIASHTDHGRLRVDALQVIVPHILSKKHFPRLYIFCYAGVRG